MNRPTQPACPPCNNNCNQGRACPSRKSTRPAWLPAVAFCLVFQILALLVVGLSSDINATAEAVNMEINR